MAPSLTCFHQLPCGEQRQQPPLPSASAPLEHCSVGSLGSSPNRLPGGGSAGLVGSFPDRTEVSGEGCGPSSRLASHSSWLRDSETLAPVLPGGREVDRFSCRMCDVAAWVPSSCFMGAGLRPAGPLWLLRTFPHPVPNSCVDLYCFLSLNYNNACLS